METNYRRSRVYSAPTPKMPPGLLELMEGLTKDVLRNSPENIYEFCADHMQKLLQIRDEKPCKNSLTLEQKIVIAQKIVRERAEKRREKYDEIVKKIEFIKQNKLHELDTSSPQCQKNIVIVPENEISIKQLEINDKSEVMEEVEPNETIVNIIDDDHIHNNISTEDSYKEETNKDTSNECDLKNKNEAAGNLNLNVESSDHKQINESDTKLITENNLHSQTLTELNENGNKMPKLESEIEAKMVEVLNSELETTPSTEIIEKEIEKVKEVDNMNNSLENGSIICDAVVNNKETTNFSQETIPLIENDNPASILPNEVRSSLELDTASILESTIIDNKLSSEAITNISNSEHIKENEADKVEQKLDEIQEVDKKSEDSETSEINQNDHNNDNVQPNTMDLETAAITIQKVFRSFLFKNKTTSIDDATNVDINLFINDKDVKENINISNVNINKERRGISRMDTVLQTVNEEKSLSLSTDDSSTLSSAATVIQAYIRGFLVRNKLNGNKTPSTSLVDSDGFSGTSMEVDSDPQKGKTILNIHIVPDKGHFISRDESLITSIDLSLDGSPPSSTNLHPHSYDINERRKQLKREDAVQSITPPSNNSSSKLSEDVDSVRECSVPDNITDQSKTTINEKEIEEIRDGFSSSIEIQTAVEAEICENSPQQSMEKQNMANDEMDVVTPFTDSSNGTDSDNQKLLHSSESHDVVLPTKVSRSDTSVVRGE